MKGGTKMIEVIKHGFCKDCQYIDIDTDCFFSGNESTLKSFRCHYESICNRAYDLGHKAGYQKASLSAAGYVGRVTETKEKANIEEATTCKTCKYYSSNATEDPCLTCLAISMMGMKRTKYEPANPKNEAKSDDGKRRDQNE